MGASGGLARFVAWVALGGAVLARTRIRSGALDPSLFAFAGKTFGSASAPFLALGGFVAGGLRLWRGDWIGGAAGILGAALSADYVRAVASPRADFETAFGSSWREGIPAWLAVRLPTQRWTPYLPAPRGARVAWNVPFWQVSPATGPATAGGARELLCDLWQPAAGEPRSGLGMIYFHAGGWQNFDKDTGTRPLFSHLTNSGHVVMDVAYRMCSETDMQGMLGDVKRAIVWLKAHGGAYGVDPNRIVLAGASAGGQLALLAAYTPCDPELEPPDVRGANTSVCAVIACYAPTDMLLYGQSPVHPDWPLLVRLGRRVGIVPRDPSYLAWPDVERRLFGALASEAPDVALRFSPVSYVAPGCPPTLLIHGAHDRIVPVERSRELYAALRGAGVPAVYLELPLVDHAFDLPLLAISPPAQSALYDVQHFLAVMALPRKGREIGHHEVAKTRRKFR